MDKYQFIIEIIRSATIIILIFDVALANRGYRKMRDKEAKLREENEKQQARIEEMSKRLEFLEKQLWGSNSKAYEEITNNPNMSDEDKQAALHKLYMNNYAEANR